MKKAQRAQWTWSPCGCCWDESPIAASTPPTATGPSLTLSTPALTYIESLLARRSPLLFVVPCCPSLSPAAPSSPPARRSSSTARRSPFTTRCPLPTTPFAGPVPTSYQSVLLSRPRRPLVSPRLSLAIPFQVCLSPANQRLLQLVHPHRLTGFAGCQIRLQLQAQWHAPYAVLSTSRGG